MTLALLSKKCVMVINEDEFVYEEFGDSAKFTCCACSATMYGWKNIDSHVVGRNHRGNARVKRRYVQCMGEDISGLPRRTLSSGGGRNKSVGYGEPPKKKSYVQERSESRSVFGGSRRDASPPPVRPSSRRGGSTRGGAGMRPPSPDCTRANIIDENDDIIDSPPPPPMRQSGGGRASVQSRLGPARRSTCAGGVSKSIHETLRNVPVRPPSTVPVPRVPLPSVTPEPPVLLVKKWLERSQPENNDGGVFEPLEKTDEVQVISSEDNSGGSAGSQLGKVKQPKVEPVDPRYHWPKIEREDDTSHNEAEHGNRPRLDPTAPEFQMTTSQPIEARPIQDATISQTAEVVNDLSYHDLKVIFSQFHDLSVPEQRKFLSYVKTLPPDHPFILEQKQQHEN